MKYGRLTVIGDIYYKPIKNFGNYQYVMAECKCGSTKEYRLDQLKCGHTKSCGCLAREVVSKTMTKHGMSNTRIYKIWKGMRKRCNNPNSSIYEHYGGKGIRVCEDWDDFLNFYNWSIKNGYNDNLSIDRLDSNGDYKPSNCRWITMSKNISKRNKENIRLTRTYKYISPHGEVGYFNNAKAFAKDFNIDSRRIYDVCNGRRKHYKNWVFEIVEDLREGQETISKESTLDDELPVEVQEFSKENMI